MLEGRYTVKLREKSNEQVRHIERLEDENRLLRSSLREMQPTLQKEICHIENIDNSKNETIMRLNTVLIDLDRS
jgi:hypothetical protein